METFDIRSEIWHCLPSAFIGILSREREFLEDVNFKENNSLPCSEKTYTCKSHTQIIPEAHLSFAFTSDVITMFGSE